MSKETERKARQRAHILVADDDELNRFLLTTLLTKRGFEVVTADSGSDAIQLAESRRPDLIVLDIRLPDMDGYEVAGKLRESSSTATTPCIAVSGAPLSRSDVDGLFNAFLEKPLDTNRLIETIIQLLPPERV